MTYNPNGTVFIVNGATRPLFENIEVRYPATGSGTAFQLQRVGEPRLRDIIIVNPGYCIDANGDNGLEYLLRDITCENPGLVGVKVWRTVTTDVGGLYLNRVKITNPAGRVGATGLLIGSDVPNTLMPTFLTDVVVDNTINADSFILTNVNMLRAQDSWFTNGSVQGSDCALPSGKNCYSAMVLNGVVEAFLSLPHFQSQSRDVSMLGHISTVRMIAPKLASAAVNIYFDSPADKSNIRVSDAVPGGLRSNHPSLLH